MCSGERFGELLQEVHGAKWDVTLKSETWRPNKEVWETEQGHVVIESGKFTNKHGVAIIVNCRWRNKINWIECASERCCCSINIGEQTADNSGQHIHATQWIPRPSIGKDIQSYRS